MERSAQHSARSSRHPRDHAWADYVPLLVLLVVTSLAASATNQAYDGQSPWLHWMQDFMGFFLMIFAMLKLFDLSRFADGFQMYDLLAKRFRPYALAYPFIELALGVGYLAEWQPRVLYPATIVITIFGSLGVMRALVEGLDLQCACMGNILKVPLSSVALIEDLGMAAMAAIMWLMLA